MQIKTALNEHQKHPHVLPAAIAFAAGLLMFGFVMDSPEEIFTGMRKIIFSQDLLITDYIAIAGPGAAFVNAGLVTMISIVLLGLFEEHVNGYTIVSVSLMAGFSLFGKNIVNIWPIIFGTVVYARYQKEPFSKYVSVSLLATSLAPLVSYIAVGRGESHLLLSLLTGMLIGFVLPPLSAYTYKVQNGMNLYNMGFACGLVAMIAVPILRAFGNEPNSVLFWSKEYSRELGFILTVFCMAFIFLGMYVASNSPQEAWKGYRRLLTSTGRAPSDFLRMFGRGPVLINMGINGMLGMVYILAVGGELNGPTLGGIATIIGFSAFGKHALNIVPVMVGVGIGAYSMHYMPDYPSLQLAGLFGTTLAPIAGHFGWLAGILAGFIHACLVLETGGAVAGVNLYNNGFSGGLIAVVLYPVITEIIRHRRPHVQDKEYYDLFEEDEAIDTSGWDSKLVGKEHATHEFYPAEEALHENVHSHSEKYKHVEEKTVDATKEKDCVNK